MTKSGHSSGGRVMTTPFPGARPARMPAAPLGGHSRTLAPASAQPALVPVEVEPGLGQSVTSVCMVPQLHDLTVAHGEDGEELTVQAHTREFLSGVVADAEHDVIVVCEEFQRVYVRRIDGSIT